MSHLQSLRYPQPRHRFLRSQPRCQSGLLDIAFCPVPQFFLLDRNPVVVQVPAQILASRRGQAKGSGGGEAGRNAATTFGRVMKTRSRIGKIRRIRRYSRPQPRQSRRQLRVPATAQLLRATGETGTCNSSPSREFRRQSRKSHMSSNLARFTAIRLAAPRFADYPCKPHGLGGKESAEADRLHPEVQRSGADPLEIQFAEMGHGESCLPVDPNSRSQTGLGQIPCGDGCGSAIRGSASCRAKS